MKLNCIILQSVSPYHIHMSILSILQSNGYKVTTPRKNVASYITTCKGLFCPQDIIRAHPDMDSVSIYRTIDLFVSLDIIHSVRIHQGHQYYELHEEQKKHHHHIVCTECQKTACIPCTLHIPEINSFNNIHHTISFTGTCSTCA
jgi:Fe2+ or Zn2+ uptake regulation protein